MIAIDTNLLIYAHRSRMPQHRGARTALDRACHDRRGFGAAYSCLLEFWSVVTHPKSDGRPSTPEEATAFLHGLN